MLGIGILIMVVLVLAGAMGNAPSAIHFPIEYANHQGCVTILTFVAAVGFLLWLCGL